jgi:hypothetical protein
MKGTPRLIRAVMLCSALPIFLTGCGTISTLKNSTITQSGSATDIVDQMVLDNVARALKEEKALPWHVQITQGAVSVSDTVSPTASYSWPPTTRMLELGASRNWAVSWTIVPELDHQKLEDLRSLYYMNTHPKLNPMFGAGSSAPSGALTGQYKGTYVWINEGRAKEFGDFVLEVLIKAPVDPSQRTIQLPGVQH